MTSVGSTKEEIKSVIRAVADLAGREPVVLLVALAFVLIEVISVPPLVAGVVPLLARFLVTPNSTATKNSDAAFALGHGAGYEDSEAFHEWNRTSNAFNYPNPVESVTKPEYGEGFDDAIKLVLGLVPEKEGELRSKIENL